MMPRFIIKQIIPIVMFNSSIFSKRTHVQNYRPDLVINQYQKLISETVSKEDFRELAKSYELIEKTILASDKIHERRKWKLIGAAYKMKCLFEWCHSVHFPDQHEDRMIAYFNEVIAKGGAK